MDIILKLENITQYNAMRGFETLHHLVSMIDIS
jgi:hypothetical protein